MKNIYFFTLLILCASLAKAQHTFSIVAVDSATGEVGSAGCTCLQAPNPPQGCLIISDLIPGKGAVHTQALWNAYNQSAAHEYLDMGVMPEEILANITRDDYDGDSTIRQYGIALFDVNGSPRAAGYTGASCMDYKAHIAGTYYSIQGNILLGPEILDSMQSRFLNTTGTLADRLMATLQGANVPGADSRCLPEGVPGMSAFVRVAKPTDNIDTLHLHLAVVSRPYGMSPIDSLQTLFNVWKEENSTPSELQDVTPVEVKLYPNPALSMCNIQFSDNSRKLVKVLDILGKVVYEEECFTRLQFSTLNYPKGAYFVHAGNSVHKLIVQ